MTLAMSASHYTSIVHIMALLLLVGARCTISPEAGRPEGQDRVRPPSSPTLNETGNNSGVKGDSMGVQGNNNIISILLTKTVEKIVETSSSVKLNLTKITCESYFRSQTNIRSFLPPPHQPTFFGS